jgi:hypothetical protein
MQRRTQINADRSCGAEITLHVRRTPAPEVLPKPADWTILRAVSARRFERWHVSKGRQRSSAVWPHSVSSTVS